MKVLSLEDLSMNKLSLDKLSLGDLSVLASSPHGRLEARRQGGLATVLKELEAAGGQEEQVRQQAVSCPGGQELCSVVQLLQCSMQCSVM